MIGEASGSSSAASPSIVDAHELQQGDEREAGRQHRGDVPQQLEVVLGDPLQRHRVVAHGGVDPLDQGLLEARFLGGLLEREVRLRARQQVLD
jgi:hypothetical protein